MSILTPITELKLAVACKNSPVLFYVAQGGSDQLCASAQS